MKECPRETGALPAGKRPSRLRRDCRDWDWRMCTRGVESLTLDIDASPTFAWSTRLTRWMYPGTEGQCFASTALPNCLCSTCSYESRNAPWSTMWGPYARWCGYTCGHVANRAVE